MRVTQLNTNCKGPDLQVKFEALTGIKGHPRAGKSRVYQGLQLAINGSLPRLGSFSDLMELVPRGAFNSGELYARAKFDTGDSAEYVALVSGGRIVQRPNHQTTNSSFLGSLPATEWANLIELGDELSLKELFWAFGHAIDIKQARGLSKEQKKLLDELCAEIHYDDSPAASLGLMKKLDSGARSLSSLINAKTDELKAIQGAEDEAGARMIECSFCHNQIITPSPGTTAAKLEISKAENRKQVFKGLLTEVSRLITEQLAEVKAHIVAEVQKEVPLGIKIDLQLNKQKCQWKVVGLDGRPHGAKVACGTERAALRYGLMRAWSNVRTQKGLPVILTLDDADFGGLTLADRRKLLESVAQDQKAGKIDQAIAVSAEDIFPSDYTIVEMEYAEE